MLTLSEDHTYIIEEDHKYNGHLVSIKLYLREQKSDPPRFLLSLDINFGRARDTFEHENKEWIVTFGITFGTLDLNLVNLDMPPTSCQSPKGQNIGIKVARSSGANNYQWQFKSSSKNDEMFGNLIEQSLGTATIKNSSFTVEAIFEGPGYEDLIITEQDNLWNDNTAKTEKVTKEIMVKKFLLSRLQDYISRYSIQSHESTDIS